MTARRSWLLAAVVAAILAALAAAPFLFPGVRAMDTAARICVFIVLAASYDLLLGYAGIVSFAHVMFFGMGAYGVALASTHLGREAPGLVLGAGAGMAVAVVLAALIGLFSLRVRAIFFAMITLAVASAVAVLVSQLSGLTGGEDGLSFQIPRALSPAAKYLSEPLTGIDPAALPGAIFGGGETGGLFTEVKANGKLAAYYLVFASMLVLLALMRRLTVSPFGSVLMAIRENEFRAEAIGYRVVRYRIAVTCISAGIAALAGALYAVWLRYVGPDTVLGFPIMVDLLLMVVIGGMGTIWGAVIGVTLFMLARGYLQDLMAAAQGAVAADLPALAVFLEPDRWLMWLGILFILSVYFFPSGIAGRLKAGR
ncbi:branched-chain amino acid ABC transporter permease [Mangrovicoccus sp. HB161399]|uniref:branched-chain amino acid ABC transporter permease n=1 Tax=Mangrovicoccus sp. HB161399 TaxID=2720392 RepID=UPI001555599F|nr:branched-chain amino acid ABC transporter permease [Mangrovicoccus sp. HB161399]